MVERARHADARWRGYRPWGWCPRIDIGERFLVKRIQVTPGGRLSLRKHVHRAEHRVVVTGTDEVTLNDQGCSHTGEDAIVRVKDIDGR